MMGSTLVPITFFGFAMLGFITQKTALGATKVVFLVLLLFLGFVSRRLSGEKFLPSLIVGVMVALVGYVVIQIKLWPKYLSTIDY